MPLINCHECEKPVSSKADKCPHCGAMVKTPFNVIITLLTMGSLGFLIYGLWKFSRAVSLFGF